MPLSLRWGQVTAVRERLDGLVRLEVDGTPCIAYPRLTGPVEEGDTVIINTQARDLELGSGGFDVLYANLTRGLGLAAAEGAHVMSLPYTPGQVAFRRTEEGRTGEGRGEQHSAAEYGGGAPGDLSGLPVVCCGLHSQLAPVCAALRGLRVAYLQLGGGALPVSLSDTVRVLRARRLIETAVAVTPCFDGDVDCSSAASAMLWTAARGFDVAVCAIGPGIVGTGTTFGHGGLAVAEAANATTALGGRPVVVPRVSDQDDRERHRGVSHHTRAALRLCLGRVQVAWPSDLVGGDWDPSIVEVDVDDWQRECEGLPLDHMGRGPADDPWFFATAFAAGRLARQLHG
jgi:Protein of unknown function (DUF3866)